MAFAISWLKRLERAAVGGGERVVGRFRAVGSRRAVRPICVLPSLTRRTVHKALKVAASPGTDSKVCTSIATR